MLCCCVRYMLLFRQWQNQIYYIQMRYQIKYHILVGNLFFVTLHHYIDSNCWQFVSLLILYVNDDCLILSGSIFLVDTVFNFRIYCFIFKAFVLLSIIHHILSIFPMCIVAFPAFMSCIYVNQSSPHYWQWAVSPPLCVSLSFLK